MRWHNIIKFRRPRTTRLYSLDGDARLHGFGQWGATSIPKDQLEFSDYWMRIGKWNQPAHELIRDLGNGCQLFRHRPVLDPDIAIAKLEIKFYWGPEELQDIMVGAHYIHASEAARDVINAVDPGAHQFFPVPFVNKQGEPWTEQTFFAMVIGPLVKTPPRSMAKLVQQRPPKSSHKLRSPKLAMLNAAEHRQSLFDEFPIWGIPFGADLVWNQEVMNAFRAAGLKGLDLIEPGMSEGDGRAVNIVDMD